MTFRLSSFAIFPALMLGASLFFASNGHAGEKQRGRPIEFSDRKSDEVTTNLNQMGGRKDGLRQLEDDLGKPFQTFNPNSSLDGMFTPPVRQPSAPSIPSKRAKELMERQKNWVFMSPEDLAGTPTEEDIFKLREYDKDGQEKKKLSPLERFMEKQQAERNRTLKKSDSKEDDLELALKGKDKKSEHDDSGLPESLRESEQTLKKLFESDATSSSLAPIAPANSFADIFGLGSPSPTLTAPENPYKEKYDRLFPSMPSSPADNFSSIPGASHVSPVDSFTPRHDSFAPALGSISFPTAPGLPDIRNFSPPPRVDAPRMAPPTPTFTVPQRKFQ